MTKHIVRPSWPTGGDAVNPGSRERKAPTDTASALRQPESGELTDRDLENVSGGARISKSDLLKLQ